MLRANLEKVVFLRQIEPHSTFYWLFPYTLLNVSACVSKYSISFCKKMNVKHSNKIDVPEINLEIPMKMSSTNLKEFFNKILNFFIHRIYWISIWILVRLVNTNFFVCLIKLIIAKCEGLINIIIEMVLQ